ncbi:MAG: V-type ATP synthase subunit D [Deltaproteobacteria bacterium]|jgi:V/A-type H+-transporting ATPase subunit D
MAEISPTRMNLLARRSQLALASRGVDLLQKKRDALVREFLSLVQETLEARKQLNAASREAHKALLMAKSFDGPGAVEAFSQSVPVLSDVQAAVQNFWGTRVPRLTAKWVRGTHIASPVAAEGRTIAAQTSFLALSRALVQVANTESRLRRMGEEIKKTARRVNALEMAVIPTIRSQIHRIQQILDQQEQEDIFRLKRIKKKLEHASPGK